MFSPERLKRTRKSQGLSLEKLAEKAGIASRASITPWERGKYYPSIDNICRLADALGVSIDYLCERTDSPEVMK